MATITEPKADLAELAERLRNAAQVIRSLRAEDPRYPEELTALRREVMAVAAKLRKR
jgi:hypothetical protein